MRFLHWSGTEARILQFEMRAAEIRVLLSPQQLDQLERLVESAHPPARCMKRDAVLLMLELEPSRAQPENQPATADDIHRRRHLRQYLRMPIGDAGYHRTRPYPPRSRP